MWKKGFSWVMIMCHDIRTVTISTLHANTIYLFILQLYIQKL